MSGQVRLKIDLQVGAVELEAPADVLPAIFDRLESFLPIVQSNIFRCDAGSQSNGDASEDGERAANDNGESSPKRAGRKPNRKKLENYSPADLQLSPEETHAFRTFFQAKAPAIQAHQVLVVMYWLTKEKGYSELSLAQIFTALRTARVRAPAKLSAVVSALEGDGKILRVTTGQYRLHAHGEDVVEHDLPAKAKATE